MTASIRVRRARGLVALATLIPLLGLATPSAVAAPAPLILRVTSMLDQVDQRPGDGICRTAAGTCTLRAAVMEANRAAGRAVIHLPAGRFRLTIKPHLTDLPSAAPNSAARGDLNLSAHVTIKGAGARRTVIDANNIDRAFQVGLLVRATITDLTITGGRAFRGLVPIAGGGAIWNDGTLTLRRTTLTKNFADYGGALFNAPWTSATIIATTISHNTAAVEAGGVRFDATGRVVNSTITANRVLPTCRSLSSYQGGAACEGGGIDIRAAGNVDIINSTIARNASVVGGALNAAVFYQGDLPVPPIGGQLRIKNSIIAGNRTEQGAADCTRTIAPVISLGHNVVGASACALNGPGDQNNVKPRLSRLRKNGGPTDTLKPRRNSPAVRGATDCPKRDQRGTRRPRTGPCTAGSVQIGP